MTARAPSPVAPGALSVATSRPVILLALRMSALIGSVLNVINQGDALFGDVDLALGKLLLTYLVPYCVATYSATSVTLRLANAELARASSGADE